MLLPRHGIPARLLLFGMMWLIAGASVTSAWSAPSDAVADRPSRVATKVIASFELPNSDPPAGFSIDLWNEGARRMRVKFTWKMVSSLPELLESVRAGNADVAIAAITMTPEREKSLDFSHPYFD